LADGFVFAAVAPHGDLVFGDDPPAAATRDAFEELGSRLEAARPDAVVVLTPHNVHVEGHFAVVTAATLAGSDPLELQLPTERRLAAACLDALRQAGLPAVAVSYGGNNADEAEMPLDWGALIPLWFLGGRAEPPVPAVVVSPARDRPLEEHVRAGAALAEAVAAWGRPVALVASADHGHAHDPDGPYGFDPAAAEYDRRVMELVRENELDRLAELGGLVKPASADSLWQMLMLHGALGRGWSAELLSYEAPTYYGMLCAAFHPAK
jgi:aromatic ring-opening dioxygenase LigB subunit